MTSLNVDQLDWKEKQLDQPTLNEVAEGKKNHSITSQIAFIPELHNFFLHLQSGFCFSQIFNFFFRNIFFQIKLQHFQRD